jgi:hypothetical protein
VSEEVVMRDFEIQLLRDARENGGVFRVAGDARDDFEAFALVEQGLGRLRDRGFVRWRTSVPNGQNPHSNYSVIQVELTAAGEDLLDAGDETRA